MSILQAFGFRNLANSSKYELPSLYPLSLDCDPFVTSDLVTLFTKILTDCIDRTDGIKPAWEHALWDNCLASESNKGLISYLACAMSELEELFLVYKEEVLRKATREEEELIRLDYKAKNSSSVGVYISFKHWEQGAILRVYSAMEYAVLDSLNKSMNLAKAIQFKMSKMRDSTGLVDSSVIINQAIAISDALACGKNILVDGEDKIETATIDMESTKSAISFLDAKRAYIVNLPLSYVTGQQTTGIGTTGEADTKAVERGLRSFWISIIKPSIKALFGADVKFKTQDFRMIASALEAVRTLDLVSEDLITLEQKQTAVAQLFGFERSEELPKEREEVAPVVDPSESDQDVEEAGSDEET